MSFVLINKKNFVVTKWLSVRFGLLILAYFATGTLQAQYEIRESGTYLVYYEINGTKPKGFEDFKSFKLDAPRGKDPSNLPSDANGNVQLAGKLVLVGGQKLTFKKAVLIKGKSGAFEELTFITKKSNGISYSFKGRFLETRVQEKPGGAYTSLRGTIEKYKNAQKVANADIALYVFAIL